MTSHEDPLITHPTGFTLPVKLAVGFTLLYLAAAAGYAYSKENKEFLFHIFAVLPALGLICLMHRRIRFGPLMLWGLSVLALLHLAGGLVNLSRGVPTEGEKILYNLWLVKPYLKYDRVVHAFGSAMATWFCWQLMQRAVASKAGWAYRDLHPSGELLLFCILSGMGFGAINEVIEFYVTRIVPDNNVGGYVNNAMDLVSNAVGSLTAATAIKLHYWRKK
ncbi:MAG: DUF2238 domain-containing protein [Candidatus Omnitrophica bacterium]|nr:DUF2238 domain-containing protein [Candidatus Omnitrophota bacterium]